MGIVNVEVLELYKSERFELCPPILSIKVGERKLDIINFRNYYFTLDTNRLRSEGQPVPSKENYDNMEQTIKTILKTQCGIEVKGFTGKTELIEDFKSMTLDYYCGYGA